MARKRKFSAHLQILVEPELRAVIEALATDNEVSLAEVAREALERGIESIVGEATLEDPDEASEPKQNSSLHRGVEVWGR